MKKIVLITGTELRHKFFRVFLGNLKNIEILKTYCESENLNLQSFVEKDSENLFRKQHLAQREQTEKDFFELFCNNTKDNSNPIFIEKGNINLNIHIDEIKKLNPDLIISYGCSILKPPLIESFKNRFINIHLGLSPYYRGSGTNFWPFVNNEIQYVGVTFMYIDSGIDTGEIFHQIRARINYNDDVHKIGNRLIYDFTKLLPVIIENFENLQHISQINISKKTEKYYKKNDFSEEALKKMYDNFSKGMIDLYLNNIDKLKNKVEIIENPILK